MPATKVTSIEASDLFVARNVANKLVTTALTLLTMLQYAFDEIQVKHTLVVRHNGGGEVNASLTDESSSLLNKWLRNTDDVYCFYR